MVKCHHSSNTLISMEQQGGVRNKYIYLFITLAHKMDRSDRSVGVDYLSMFHPNNPPLVLGMLVQCVTTDTSSSN